MSKEIRRRRRRLTKAEARQRIREYQQFAVQEVARPDFALRWATQPVTAMLLIELAKRARNEQEIARQDASTGPTGDD